MKKAKYTVTIALVTLLMVSMTACGNRQGDGTTTLRLGTTVNERDSFQVAAEKFAELISERTDGAYVIEIFPNGVLGDERTMLESMQLGILDMGIITSGPFVNFVPAMGVLDMPFLFETNEEAYKILDGEIGRELLTRLQTVNLKGLAYAERGFRNLTNSQRPVRSAADVSGLGIRVMENPIYISTFRALDVNTIPMAWPEALTALQQGTIHGQENPVNVIHSFMLWETQRYVTMTRHAYASAIITMSLARFNRLSPEIQRIFQDAAQEAAVYQRAWTARYEAQQIAYLEANGMQIIHDPDIESFRRAVASVYDEFRDQYGVYLSRISAVLGR